MQVLGLLFTVFFFVESAVAGPIYVWKDKHGVTHFTSTPAPKGFSAKVFTGKRAGYSVIRGNRWKAGPLFLNHYTKPIVLAAERYRVDPALIRAVIHVESAFRRKAVSKKGALGLMQIMPGNLPRLGVSDPFSPIENIHGGTKLLSSLLKRYGGNLRKALAAYNAGEGAVDRYKGIPPYPETRNYVVRVSELHRRYRKALA